MEKKINIAELLKDCPKGMELDCTTYDCVEFMEVDTEIDTIILRVGNKFIRRLNKYGQNDNVDYSKCVILPKGKTTWEGFVPPCKFEDGDIIFVHTNALKCNLDNSWVAIFKEYRNNRCACYMCLCLSGLEFYHDKWEDELLCELCEMEESRLATEEEKVKLFQAIKANGYKWNEETKTLEKLVEPKFKVGDRIKSIISSSYYTVVDIKNDQYFIKSDTEKYPYQVPFSNEINYKLVPNKFDITTLKPFDKVLVRSSNCQIWTASMFSFYSRENIHPFACVGGYVSQCIPYEDNQHLLGTTDDCDEFYKTWLELTKSL